MSEESNEKPYIIDTKTGRYIAMSRNDLIASFLEKNGHWEEHIVQMLKAFLQHLGGDLVDVGANMGAVAIPVALAFPKSRVYCFEAQRIVYQQLCGNAVLNQAYNVYPYHLAIGAPEDAGTMIDVPFPDYARDTNIGSISLDNRVNKAEGFEFDRYESVTQMPLDALGLTNIGVVKIDVEGMELKVLQGMKEMLRANNFPAIVFEIWRDAKYDWVQNEKEEIVNLLEALDYRLDIHQTATLGIAQHKSKTYINFELNFTPSAFTIEAKSGRR